MIKVNVPVNVENMETWVEFLEDGQERPCHNSFMDLHEPEILDEIDYKQVQYKRYGYAVRNIDDSF